MRPPAAIANASAACGEVVWTSNWVPSQWSVRQLWAGDVLGLALAYYLAGLPDDGFNVLRGTLEWVMLQSVVPGQIGGTNGGTVSRCVDKCGVYVCVRII